MKKVEFSFLSRNAFFLMIVAALFLVSDYLPAQSVATTGPGLSDEQFFALLDYSKPGLAEVQKAAVKSDWDTAKKLLASYMRKRPMPKWTFDSHAVGKEPGYNAAEAGKVMKHLLRSISIDWQFGEKIDWAFNPTTQPDSKWARNHEWTWQLSRHPMWAELSRAYYATGNEKYAKEFVAQLKSWITDCPVPVDKPENVPLSRWRTIEAGIRMGSVWPDLFFRFLQSKSFDDNSMILMLKSFAEHAQYLTKFPTKGNWLTMESNGLYHVGAIFPEFKDAKLWRDTAIDRLYKELDIQVYPDGAQIELAPGYHGVALRNFLGPVKLIPLSGFELPADYLAKMEKMFAYFLYSMQPGFRMPPLNDSGSGDISGYMKEAAGYFPKRLDFKWAASNGVGGKPPVVTSCEFPYAGQFVMRSGWDKDARWLLMDGGPFGFGHQHEDKLSVILTAYGKQLLVEGGVYTYDASDWRKYVLSSRAHNIVLVDGLEQHRRKGPRESFVVSKPVPHIWESNKEFDHAAARFDEGYGPDALRLVKQTRHVFFVKPNLFIVADQLESIDNKPHKYEALFHLDASDAKKDGLLVTTVNPGPNLTIKSMDADGVNIIKGQKEPVVQGWIPDGSSGYGGIRPIPVAVFSKQASGKCTMVYVIWPSKKVEEFPVDGVAVSDNALIISYSNGKKKAIWFKMLE